MQEADQASAVETLRKTDARIGELIGKVQGIQSEVAAMKRDLSGPRADGGNVTFTVNAGGVALWLSALCCVVMLVCTAVMALGLYWVAMDSRDRGHQMNALYMSVPGLRELVEEQMKLNEKTQRDPNEEAAR